ncbi:MAG: hypothetical protein AAF357_03585, partial [Verrucomicrobiota bacterium]
AEVLVKHETSSPASIEARPESLVEAAPDLGPELLSEEEPFVDLEKERDSVKAVTDVRVFAGRIEEPRIEEYTGERIVAEPVSAQKGKDTSKKVPAKVTSKTSGPFELREILPVSRY